MLNGLAVMSITIYCIWQRATTILTLLGVLGSHQELHRMTSAHCTWQKLSWHDDV